MTAKNYKKLILEGIKGLPAETLTEIINFIYFLRKKKFQPQEFNEELECILLNNELHNLSNTEESHLEEEFKDYDRIYPRE